jgi:hypothetical protein
MSIGRISIMSTALTIKQVSSKPAIPYASLKVGVVFTFINGSLYGNTSHLKLQTGHLNLNNFQVSTFRPIDGVGANPMCTAYKATLQVEM